MCTTQVLFWMPQGCWFASEYPQRRAVAGGSDVAAKTLKAILLTRVSGKRITTAANKEAEKDSLLIFEGCNLGESI